MYLCIVSLAWADAISTRAMTCTTPVVFGSDKIARAIPPRVLVWDGASDRLSAHPGSTSNVTGTPSTGRPWASCTRTINSAVFGNRAAMVEGTGPSQTIGLETCREKTYPELAVGPTSGGAQA